MTDTPRSPLDAYFHDAVLDTCLRPSKSLPWFVVGFYPVAFNAIETIPAWQKPLAAAVYRTRERVGRWRDAPMETRYRLVVAFRDDDGGVQWLDGLVKPPPPELLTAKANAPTDP